MKRSFFALGVPGAFLFAAYAMRSLTTLPPARLAVDFVQPVVVATNWGAYGRLLFFVLFAMLFAATIVYFHVLRHLWYEDRRYELHPWAIAVIAVAASICAWLVPILFSSDVYAYAAYGELARLGHNPYAHALLPAGDPVFEAAIWQWGNPLPVCVYGPIFVASAQAVVAALHAFGIVAQLDGLRALATLAIIACVPLAVAAYPGTASQRWTAAFTIGLNPAALWCAVEGHNDAIAVAIVLAGLAIARSGRPALGGALAALAGTIKLPGILGAAPAAISGAKARIGATIGCAVALAASIPLAYSAATELAPHGRYAPQASFEAIVKPLALAAVTNDTIATAVTWLIAAVAALLCVRTGASRLRDGRAEGWVYFALGGWLLIPNPYPWYALWLLPIAALAPETRPAAVAILLSLFSVLRYVPDAVGAPAPPAAAILGVAATLPYLALFRAK